MRYCYLNLTPKILTLSASSRLCSSPKSHSLFPHVVAARALDPGARLVSPDPALPRCRAISPGPSLSILCKPSPLPSSLLFSAS